MFRVLHLSDLHAKSSNTWSTAPILFSASQVLKQQSERNNFDVVAFTGDIAFSGQRTEYDFARRWIDETFLSPKGLNLTCERMLFVPGNHDVDRSQRCALARALEEKLGKATNQEEAAEFLADPACTEILLKRHAAYRDFCRSIRGDEILSLPAWTQFFEHAGNRLLFEGYCTSWLCRGDDDRRRLLIGQPQLQGHHRQRIDADLIFTLMHHPLADLMEFDELSTEQQLRVNRSILLRGHLHRQDAVSRQSPNGGYLELAAGALHESSTHPNSFRIIDIADDRSRITITTYIWIDGQWLPDRTRYPSDGSAEIDISFARRKDSISNVPPAKVELLYESTQSTINESTSAAEAPQIALDSRSKSRCLLATIPRFQPEPLPVDLATRQHRLEEAVLIAESHRLVQVRAEWGTNPSGFLRALVYRLRSRDTDTLSLHIKCNEATTGTAVQASMALAAQITASELGAALKKSGSCIIVLEGISESSKQMVLPTVTDTLTAFLDYCPDLTIITMSYCVAAPIVDSPTVLPIGPFDAADTKCYMERHPVHPVTLDSMFDYDRVHKATDGLASHVDSLVQAMAYTSLDDAIASLSDSPKGSLQSLPEVVTSEIEMLAQSDLDQNRRAYSMLSILSILDHGESLAVIKRVQPHLVLWPTHAKILSDLGVLEVIDRYQFSPGGQRKPSADKILRVPKLVRDYVLQRMGATDRLTLIRLAAELYFGSDWRTGSLRVRSRPSFAASPVSHEPQNELAIVRLIMRSSFSQDADRVCSAEEAVNLALKFVDHLQRKGFYGEGYEAARDAVGTITSRDLGAKYSTELAELQLLAGKCARMVGDRKAAVELLSLALPVATATGVASRTREVLVSLALTHDQLGHKHDAIRHAEEGMAMAEKNSADYFQCQAIITGLIEDAKDRKTGLLRLLSRARNHQCYVVCENIALDLASMSSDTEEALSFVAQVRAGQSREYNYIRATIRRAEVLLKSHRAKDISDVDREELRRCYQIAYAQRMKGIFTWCHRVLWDYYDAIGQRQMQEELFVHSSFIWRLSGDRSSEMTYVVRLNGGNADARAPVGVLLSSIWRYCMLRYNALTQEKS